MKDYIKIDNIEKNDKKLNIRFSTSDKLKKFFKTLNFWIEYDFEIGEISNSILAVPFIANIMPIAWLTNAKIIVDEIDSSFYNSINLFKKGYIKMYPNVKFYETNIEYNSIISNNKADLTTRGVLFSGGVDAFTTLYSHLNEKPLLITIWGADIETTNNEAWSLMKKMCIDVGKKFELPNHFVKSNFKEFLNTKELNKIIVDSNDKWWHGFQHGIGLISLAAPLCWNFDIDILYIASSYTKEDKNVTCASYPTIDENIHFGDVNVIHDQFELNRQQKIEKIVKISNKINKYPTLHVCWENSTGKNCCKCEKCCRTILGILIENESPEKYGFESVNGKYIKKRMYFYNNIDVILYPLWNDMINKYNSKKKEGNYNKDIEWLSNFNVERQHFLLKKIFRKVDGIIGKIKK